MVLDVEESRLLMLFIEGLTELVKGWVKAFKPITLQDAIERTMDLVGVANKNRFTPKPPMVQRGHDTRPSDIGKGKLDEATRRDLRSKQLCCTCRDPWQPRHRCLGKGKIHYVEVVYDSEEEADDDDDGAIHTMQANLKEEQEALLDHETPIPPEKGPKKITIASMSGILKFNTFRIKGVV